MEGGLEIRVLDGANTRSVPGSGCESLEGSVTLDSWMGTTHGICPWDSTLVMRKFDGGCVLGGLWMVFDISVFLWDPCRGGTGTGKRHRLSTYIRVVFHWTTCVVKQLHFLCCMLYIDQWGFHWFILQDHRERSRRVSIPWSDTCVLKFRHT